MSKSKVNLWETHTLTTLSITLVMFLLGLCLLVEYHAYRATRDMQERITFKVGLNPDITDEGAADLKRRIEAMPSVKHVDYISSQQAAEIFSEELNEDFVGFIGYNPLHPSLMVNLRSDLVGDTRRTGRTEAIDNFRRQLAGIEQVTEVNYQENVVNELNNVFYKITWFLIIFMALLLVASMLMIRSTISIALFAQRDTIRTMQLVGAKPAFISRPFRMRSISYGLWGSLIACVVLAVAMGVFNQSFSADLLNPVHMPWYAVVGLLIILIGITLSYLSTRSAVRRYLRKN